MKILKIELDSQKIEEITHLPIAHRFNWGYSGACWVERWGVSLSLFFFLSHISMGNWVKTHKTLGIPI
jgi:hypothetical protein